MLQSSTSQGGVGNAGWQEQEHFPIICLSIIMSDETFNTAQKMNLPTQISVALDNRKLGTEESLSSGT